jgi:SAM-dependent methyltransferase
MEVNTSESKIKPIAIPGIHERFFSFLLDQLKEIKEPVILDAGAGHGALSKKLHMKGFNISACDLFPEIFYYQGIECKLADLSKSLPYPDNSFDVVFSVEVMEHIHDHESFFRESLRILKPGGMLLVSTPNILSFKSRLRFLLSGFFYSFEPIDFKRNDGLQHLASLTINQYFHIGYQTGFAEMDFFIDKKQNSSQLLSMLIPFAWFYCKRKKLNYSIHNQYKLLVGRVLFLQFMKPE